jgi:hypothetical protein
MASDHPRNFDRAPGRTVLRRPRAASAPAATTSGVWHIPAFYLGGTPHTAWSLLPFLIGVTAVGLVWMHRDVMLGRTRAETVVVPQ